MKGEYRRKKDNPHQAREEKKNDTNLNGEEKQKNSQNTWLHKRILQRVRDEQHHVGNFCGTVTFMMKDTHILFHLDRPDNS